ncbi:MAG: DUF4445 domain-containing protein [Deltaproteobacteria bacterium]|nr:DUF4445 domain-containing protein [Deltaproteobacteria bacterium]
MTRHPVTFTPSGRTAVVDEKATILAAARAAGEPVPAECAGRGACGRCLVKVVGGEVPEHAVQSREAGVPLVLACQTSVCGPLTLQPLASAELPPLLARDHHVGAAALESFSPFHLDLDPVVAPAADDDLGVVIDVGTTTLQLLLVRLRDGVVVGETGKYNPQIRRGADVVSRIVAAEKGLLADLTASVRTTLGTMIAGASVAAAADPDCIRAYVVAGNLTMIHLLLGVDPAGIRRVPSEPEALAFEPVSADYLGWPGSGGSAPVHTMPAAGGWVGGDIVAGLVRAGFSRESGLGLYVDLGTNGEVALGGRDFALACACSAGPAFEGGGIRCGMRADAGAIDGARVSPDLATMQLSVIGEAPPCGVCGSGLIALAEALWRAGWIDRAGRLSDRLPPSLRVDGEWGAGVALDAGTAVARDDGQRVVLWERDLASLVRAKGAIFAGIRTLHRSLGDGAGPLDRVVVSGNFGRFLKLPAAVGIGLLPDLPPGRFGYVANGSLEGATLALLSRAFRDEVAAYLRRLTYVDLSEVPGYMDEFVAACFLPHTTPEVLRL